MGFKNGAYAKVFNVKEDNGRRDARIAISRKTDNGYAQTFSGWVGFRGDAASKAEFLMEGDRIKLLEVDVTNRFIKNPEGEGGTVRTTYTVYDFEPAAPPADDVADI